MKASLNWIKGFVDIDVPPQEIADRLSMAGLEVESIERLGAGLESVLTAAILKVEKHPNADRLSLCEVRCGQEVVSVVCGATNMKVGDKVALARPGARLPNGTVIQESTIRGVKSFGMLCSETELGLADKSEGILILDGKIPDGLLLGEALSVRDTIFEVNVTPNRGDCLSTLGLAREVAANYRLRLNIPVPKLSVEPSASTAPIQVFNEAPELCRRYSCRVVQGVKIQPSPLAVQQRLQSCGIRPINNVVDATNYAMLETGQPLHAFDLSQIKQQQIVIRRAKDRETMKTLDGQDRVLQNSDLVIADAERVLALAGVMGGLYSGVGEQTVDLLLESACFAPGAVRGTAKRLALQTDSSFRFERGVDPNGCVAVLDRLTQLILEWAGGKSIGSVIDNYPAPQKPLELTLRSPQVKRVLGLELSNPNLLEDLRLLGIAGKETKAGELSFAIPSFRADLTREIDLIEEVARIHGYNQIPTSYPKISLDQIPPWARTPLEQFDELRNRLVDWGFSEVLHYSFASPDLLKKFGVSFSETQRLVNPISEELSVLRASLIPQMVQTIQSNLFKGNHDLKLFELRPAYLPDPNAPHGLKENWVLCLGVCGRRSPLHFLDGSEAISFLDLKGYLTALFSSQSLPVEEGALHEGIFHPRRQAIYYSGGEALARAGELHPQVSEDLDIRVPVALAEINLELFLTESKISIQFKKISPFPTVGRDLNLIVDEATPQGGVREAIRQGGGPWLQKVTLFDVYRGHPLQEGKKALTYRIEYGDPARTLTDDEVNQAREELLEKLKAKVGAQLR